MFHQALSRKSLVYSAVGHLAVLSLVAVSFGQKLPGVESYGRVSFWSDIPISARYKLKQSSLNNIKVIGDFFRRPQGLGVTPKALSEAVAASPGYIKPSLEYGLGFSKSEYVQKSAPERFVRKGTEPNIVFHPILPYGFTLYFKDRHVAHVEVMFRIIPTQTGNAIAIKRKISSGNPEVDLLTMRYMSHYLFIQQNRFSPNSWHTVKIDLSEKE